LQLIGAAKAQAALQGREYVLPDDIDSLAVAVLGHRLVPTSRALGHHHQDSTPLIEEVVRRIVAATPVPVGAQGRP
jgi:MoxR-like ATPase